MPVGSFCLHLLGGEEKSSREGGLGWEESQREEREHYLEPTKTE